MTAITNEQKTEILKIVAGLFNAAPGGIYLSDFSDAVGSGMSTLELAESLASESEFVDGILAGRVTAEEQAAVLMEHFGFEVGNTDPASADAQAEAYFVGQIEAGVGFGQIVFDAVQYLSTSPAPEFADAAALLANKALVAGQYSLNNSSADLAKLQSILAGVTSTFPTTVAEAQDFLDGIGEGDNPGNEFVLTFGADSGASFTGGAGDDTFTAGVVNNGAGTLVNSLEDADILNGGGGNNVLNAVLNAATTTTPSITDIQIINIRNIDNDATLDFTDTTGAEQIWNNASSSARTLTFDAAPIAATFGVRNTKSTTDINTFDDVTGAEDNLALAVTGAGSDTTDAVITSATDNALIETMSIAATGENYIDVSIFDAITKLTVTGDGSLEALVGVGALEELDASGNNGGVTVDLGASAINLTITGSGGDDVITAGTADDTLDLGAGDDRAVFATGTFDGNDTAEGGDDTDTLAIDGDDAGNLDSAVHTGFEELEFTGATGAVTFDNADFDFSKVILSGDVAGGGDLTLDNLGDSTLEIQTSQTTNGIFVTADSLDVVINADAAVTVNSLDVTDVATVNVSTTADTDDTTFTAIEVDGVTSLAFSGAGDITLTDITDADTANDGLTEIDLTGLTGGFLMAANNLGSGTTFKLGDLGNTGTANYDFDDDATNDEASEILGTGGERDVYEFTTQFEGNVAIVADDPANDFGTDVGDDVIDLSALGITADDLTFTLVGDGAQVTSDAFGGGQILLVGVTNLNQVNIGAFDFT